MTRQERSFGNPVPERRVLSSTREHLFREAEKELRFPIQVYRLGDRFKDLPSELASITMLDVTRVHGCHYGVRNVFGPIIEHLEKTGASINGQSITVSPESAILVEPSTGNGWVAFSDAAEKLGYEHFVIMPKGLPEARYRHPSDRKVHIEKTPAEEYALGMPKALMALIRENRKRHAQGEKIYVTPNHPIGAADITAEAMSEIGKQLVRRVGIDPITAVISMGNGASLYSIGKYLKDHTQDAQIIATESFNFGGGFDKYTGLRGYRSYREVFGIDPGNAELMKKFKAYGTNAPIGVELPLQTKAMSEKIIAYYRLFVDDDAVNAYQSLGLESEYNTIVSGLPNYDHLPHVLYETFGNSTLGNIAVAQRFARKGKKVVAMAYDGRENY